MGEQYQVSEVNGTMRFTIPGIVPSKGQDGTGAIITSGGNGDIVTLRLRSACSNVLSEVGEAELYGKLVKHLAEHLPKGDVDALETMPGAGLLVRDICLQKGEVDDIQAGHKSKKKRKKNRSRSTQLIPQSCTDKLLFWEAQSWQETLKAWQGKRHKFEL